MNYERLQETWLDDNNIVVGSKVKVLRSYNPEKDDELFSQWREDIEWIPGMDKYIGSVYNIEEITSSGIILDKNHYRFPFFCLEKYDESKVKETDLISEYSKEVGVSLDLKELIESHRRQREQIRFYSSKFVEENSKKPHYSETDYGDFTEYEVRCLVAEYCKDVTTGISGWGTSFINWLELNKIAKHDKNYRLIKM